MSRIAQPSAVWRRAVVLVLACIVLAIISSSERLHEALLEVLAVTQTLIDQHPIAGAVVFVLVAAFSALFTFVSVAVIVPAAVFTWGTATSMALLWLGWIGGGVIAYSVGKHLGRPAVSWLLGGDTFERMEQRVPRDAPFWLVLLMQTALPSEITGYVLGMVRYPFLRFLTALGIAELPYTLATVYLGSSFVERRAVVILLAGMAIAVLSVGAFHFLRRAMRTTEAGARDRSRPNDLSLNGRSNAWIDR